MVCAAIGVLRLSIRRTFSGPAAGGVGVALEKVLGGSFC